MENKKQHYLVTFEAKKQVIVYEDDIQNAVSSAEENIRSKEINNFKLCDIKIV